MKNQQLTEMLVGSLADVESKSEESVSISQELSDIDGFDTVKVTQKISLSPMDPGSDNPGDLPRFPDIRNPDDLVPDLVRRLRSLDDIGKERCTKTRECWYEGVYGTGGVRKVCRTITVCVSTGD
ncbi:hypothetical protein MIB92_12185 [Aestuariirhabdus sp. Z084]|uniref:hypothetical protein n=1 Tax=Aestuariirhabdus haliotis TaxID=2918751 RepID=UPI00201B4655|nr:hypothetical protein [Aestuariirhabdus haliotis]MCL6416412.1 hypothetical protein [Aestuariirhabdus haliotis]MCL6420422.1 hypothetical protein [Aestuariirhabdus haliotis]